MTKPSPVEELRKRLRRSKEPTSMKVLVELTPPRPSDRILERLAGLGLEVERVVGNKVVGTIPQDKLSELEADDDVEAVERSVPLKLHW